MGFSVFFQVYSTFIYTHLFGSKTNRSVQVEIMLTNILASLLTFQVLLEDVVGRRLGHSSILDHIILWVYLLLFYQLLFYTLEEGYVNPHQCLLFSFIVHFHLPLRTSHFHIFMSLNLFHIQGLWLGILCALTVQVLLLLFITMRTNWEKEVKIFVHNNLVRISLIFI